MDEAPDDLALRELFRTEAEGIAERLEVLVQAGTAEALAEARRLAHTLKGLAVALGAHPLRDLARSLEEGLAVDVDRPRLLSAVDAARALIGGAAGAAGAARAAAVALEARGAPPAAPAVPWARRGLARRLAQATAPVLTACDTALVALVRGRDDRRGRNALARELEVLAAGLGLAGRADAASLGLALAGLLHERAPSPTAGRAAVPVLEELRGAITGPCQVDLPLGRPALAACESLRAQALALDEARVERLVELPWPDTDRPVDLIQALERITHGSAILDARPADPDGRALRGVLGLGPPRAGRREDEGFVRVPRRRLDRLLRLSEELVAQKARARSLSRRAAALVGEAPAGTGLGLSRLARDAAELDRSLDDLARRAQEAVLRARLVPVRGLWALARVTVREHLARHPDKDVALDVEGAGTEVDKGVVDQLVDPLLHLVRNALVHGVTSRAARGARGKPERARVRLSARATAAGVVLEVEDDGQGLDEETLARDADRLAVVRDGDGGLTLAAAPGARAQARPRTVTDDSGRGLGLLSVVERVRALRGRLELQITPGRGTLVRIVLPPAAATARVLLVRVGGERYALPLPSIVAVREAREGGPPGAVRLADLVGPVPDEKPERRSSRFKRAAARERRGRDRFAVILARPSAPEAEGVDVGTAGGLAVLVDDVLRRDLVVVRPLGRRFAPQGIDGAALLGDGRLVLVVDPWRLRGKRAL